MASEKICATHLSVKDSVSFARWKAGKMEFTSTAHKVGINVHHFQWCTKYRYQMLRQEKYKKLAKMLFASRLNDTISRFVNCSSCQSTFISPARFHRVCRRAKLCNYSKGDQAIFFSESSLSSGCVTRADIFGVRVRMQEVLATTLWT